MTALSGRRRFSLSSFTPSASSSLRRLSTLSTSSTDQPPLDKPLPTIPFAEPPFMPMFRHSQHSPQASPSLPSTSSTKDMAREEKAGVLRISTSTASRPTSQSYSSSPSQPQAPSASTQGTPRTTSRLFRRLHRRGNGRGELDFGCVGEWNEGPSDLSSSYYDSHRSNRNSSSSVEVPALTHSRGYSSSSSYSTSTAASSLPPSPTLNGDVFLPHCSRVPLSPRTSQKYRQSDEVAAVDAANDYFARMRLTQIEEDAPLNSVTINDNHSSSSTFQPQAHPPLPSSFSTEGQGLAIFGASKKTHDRTASADLEIEFIETGHTTFTPLAVDSPSYSSAILLPEDAFFTSSSSSSDDGYCFDIDTSEEEESHSSSTCTTNPIGRTPIPERDIGPALDELSTFFASPVDVSPVVINRSTFIPTPTTPPMYSRARRPDSFQAAQQARLGRAPVSYAWI